MLMNIWVLCTLFSMSSSTALWKSTFGIFLVVQWLRLDGSASGEVGLIPGQELRFYTLICAVKFSFLNTKESTLEQSHSNFSRSYKHWLYFFLFLLHKLCPQRDFFELFSKFLCDFLFVLWLEIHFLNFKHGFLQVYIYIYIPMCLYYICIIVR